VKYSRAIAVLAGGLGLIASLLTGSPAGAAVNYFHAWITCDPVTNQITTGVTGLYGVAPSWDVVVDFKVESGYAATATTSAAIPATGSVTSVPGRSTAAGDLTVAGYSRNWPISNHLFYTEKVVATVKNTSGGILATRTAMCHRDLRSTVTMTCDRAAQKITARIEGTQFNEYEPGGLWIRYEREWRSGSATGPIFSSRFTEATHALRSVDGAFSDVGWVKQMTTDPEFYEETVWATVILAGTGRTIGYGTATCVYSD
jgi:hypothetical protein